MGVLNWLQEQYTGAVDSIQGNDKPLFDFIWAVDDSQIQSLKQEANTLSKQAESVEEYCEALTSKANAVKRIVSANLRTEEAIASLAVDLHDKTKKLAPLRRKFRSVDRNFQQAAMNVRQQGTDIWRWL